MSSSSNNNTNVPNQAMWLGLLQWSLRQSDGTRSSEINEIKEEDRLFLQQVFDSMTKDEPKRLQEILYQLTNFIDSYENINNINNINYSNIVSIPSFNMIEILYEISDIIEQIDMAQVFTKFSGLHILIQLIELPIHIESNNSNIISEEIQCEAASIIGRVAQNNELVLGLVYEQGIIDKVCKLFLNLPISTLSSKVSFFNVMYNNVNMIVVVICYFISCKRI